MLEVPEDFVTSEFRAECERLVNIDLAKPADCKEAFIYLKQNFSESAMP